jgi:hypothetical protein
MCRNCHGQAQFLKAEVLYHYEHSSHFRVADDTIEKLLAEVSDEDYIPYELPDRIRCDKLNQFLAEHIDLDKAEDCAKLIDFFGSTIQNADHLVEELVAFVQTQPKLPVMDKQLRQQESLAIMTEMTREEIIAHLRSKRSSNAVADLAFYAYRDMDQCEWEPFLKAAFMRNPVSLKMANEMSIEQVYAWLLGMHNRSIYDGNRLAQPDEVVNYKTGDGIEKALVLAIIAHHRSELDKPIELVISEERALVTAEHVFCFPTSKSLRKEISVSRDGIMNVR